MHWNVGLVPDTLCSLYFFLIVDEKCNLLNDTMISL